MKMQFTLKCYICALCRGSCCYFHTRTGCPVSSVYIRIRLTSYASIGFGHRVRSAVPEKSCCYYMQCALGR